MYISRALVMSLGTTNGPDNMNVACRTPPFYGSEQEFDGKPILRGFPEGDEFGLGDGHAVSLEKQVA